MLEGGSISTTPVGGGGSLNAAPARLALAFPTMRNFGLFLPPLDGASNPLMRRIHTYYTLHSTGASVAGDRIAAHRICRRDAVLRGRRHRLVGETRAPRVPCQCHSRLARITCHANSTLGRQHGRRASYRCHSRQERRAPILSLAKDTGCFADVTLGKYNAVPPLSPGWQCHSCQQLALRGCNRCAITARSADSAGRQWPSRQRGRVVAEED